MISLSHETEFLALRLADAQHLPVDAAVQQALEHRARAVGLGPPHARRRMSVEDMLAMGAEIASMPVRDSRSAGQIMDDLNAV